MDFQKAVALVRETKAIVMDAEASHCITVKGEADYVTQTDFRVQAYLIERLQALAPEAGGHGDQRRAGDEREGA